MATFQLTSVDQNGVDAILANPLPGSDFGNLVGRPVEFARKVVGQVTRIYRDSVGPWVAKVHLDDMNSLRLAATGCLTALNIGAGSIELADRPSDHGTMFEYTKADGSRLAKRFIGLPDSDLAKHADKVYADRPLSKNERVALLLKGTEFEPHSIRKPVTSREQRGAQWPNGTPVGTAREIVPNRNSRV